MRKTICFLVLLCIFNAYTLASAEPLCSIELFPTETVSKLFWGEGRQSFVVGLGEPLANEYTYDYKSIHYEDQIIDISHSEIVDSSLVRDLVGNLGISEQFYENYDSTQLFLSPDYQNALYLQENQLNIFNLETGTFNHSTFRSPVGDIEQISWIDDGTFLLVATPPYGIGHEIIKGCIDRNCLRYLTASLNEPIGSLAISNDHHFAIASNLIDPSSLVLIDLTQEDASTYAEIRVPFLTQTDVASVWSGNRNEVYVMGSEATPSDITHSIYRVLFEGETLLEATQVVELDDELASSTSLWLVDSINRLSIHALRNGGLEIFCWD